MTAPKAVELINSVSRGAILIPARHGRPQGGRQVQAHRRWNIKPAHHSSLLLLVQQVFSENWFFYFLAVVVGGVGSHRHPPASCRAGGVGGCRPGLRPSRPKPRRRWRLSAPTRRAKHRQRREGSGSTRRRLSGCRCRISGTWRSGLALVHLPYLSHNVRYGQCERYQVLSHLAPLSINELEASL